MAESLILERLINAIDEVDATNLIEKFGGSSWWIPVREFAPTHPFRQVLSIEKLNGLIAEFGGCKIPIPVAKDWVRNRRIFEDRTSMTIQSLSLKYRLSERHVYHLLASPAMTIDLSHSR